MTLSADRAHAHARTHAHTEARSRRWIYSPTCKQTRTLTHRPPPPMLLQQKTDVARLRAFNGAT